MENVMDAIVGWKVESVRHGINALGDTVLCHTTPDFRLSWVMITGVQDEERRELLGERDQEGLNGL
jgi:hypothetical protein